MTAYFLNVTDAPYNAPNDRSADASTAIQKAIDDASAAGTKATVLIPAGEYRLDSGLSIENASSVQIQGEGAFNGTTFFFGQESGDVITFNNCQHCNLSLINIQYSGVATGGNAIVLTNNCYVVEIHDVRMDYCFNGIWIQQATETRLSKTQFRYLLGFYGVKFGGGSANQSCYRAILHDIIADNPLPLPYPDNTVAHPTGAGNWQADTAYNEKDTVVTSNGIYQCIEPGTSGTTEPSDNPNGLRNPTPVSDGGVSWQFVSRKITWVVQESNGFSLVLSKAALLNGWVGYSMQNTSAPETPPLWIIGDDIECDHSYYANIQLLGGSGAYINNSWFGSCFSGNGMNIIPPFQGQVSMINVRLSFAAQHGIFIGTYGTTSNPKDILIQNNFIGGNGQSNPNTYNGIVVAGDVKGLQIIGNKIGTDLANPHVSQYSGVFIKEADQFIVTNNNLIENITQSLVIDTESSNYIAKDNLEK
ncbi:glycosyl hydrolase family 28-related protein [Dapis sp. BLCC M229]|uniref:glycosyl hydrolase family 28-related protein n=1 Tax=Dapis sp. BLCC M229 TaxID=3400188 RepID=UPI003CF8E131